MPKVSTRQIESQICEVYGDNAMDDSGIDHQELGKNVQ